MIETGPKLSAAEFEAFADLYVASLTEGPNLAGARASLQRASRQGLDPRCLFDVLAGIWSPGYPPLVWDEVKPM